MEVLGHGFQAAFGGIFALVPIVHRYFTRMPIDQALRNALLLLFAFSAASVLLKQGFWLKQRYAYETLQTHTALIKDEECQQLSDLMRSDAGINEFCTKAKITKDTSPAERALAAMVESWPDPRNIGNYFTQSIESRITSLSLMAWLLSVVAPYIFGPPMRFIGTHYANAGHEQLLKAHTT